MLGQWRTPGLKALMEVAGGLPDTVAASHVGFALGPRINAAGRIGRADLGARLLSTDDPAEAAALAQQLDQLNRERREVEAAVAEAAMAQVEARGGVDSRSVILVAGEGWHAGVVGVVAGRLRERWRKPVIVAGVDPVAGVARGSGRSQSGVNLGGAVQAAWEAGLLLAGGGHAMACGLTAALDALPALEAFLDARLAGQQAEARQADTVDIDVLVEPAAATRALLDSFTAMQPFGPGNPEPLFAFSGVTARDPALMNGGHVRCRLTAPDGSALRAVGWRLADQPGGEALLSGAGGLAVAGRLKPDDWNGRRGVQLEIEDVHDPRRA
jgi:single-stranded-DNA-specific exonuclease